MEELKLFLNPAFLVDVVVATAAVTAIFPSFTIVVIFVTFVKNVST